MGSQERAIDRGNRLGRAALVQLGDEVRMARTARGVSQRAVGDACDLSQSTIGRIERGAAPGVPLIELARVLSAVGLDIVVRSRPGAAPIRDFPHARLISRVRDLLPPGTPFALEVGLPNPGDPRAWDAVIRFGRIRVPMEAETRPRDLQELLRRLSIKRRDGGVDCLVLLLLDSRSNRALLREAGDLLATAFPVGSREAIDALRAGRPPRGDALILL